MNEDWSRGREHEYRTNFTTRKNGNYFPFSLVKVSKLW
jgi:hypothetical protein